MVVVGRGTRGQGNFFLVVNLRESILLLNTCTFIIHCKKKNVERLYSSFYKVIIALIHMKMNLETNLSYKHRYRKLI